MSLENFAERDSSSDGTPAQLGTQLRRKGILIERGKALQEVVPGLCSRLEPPKAFQGRPMNRETGHRVFRRSHGQ